MNTPVDSTNLITIDDATYYWEELKSDIVTDICVCKDNAQGQTLKIGFNYHRSLNDQAKADIDLNDVLLRKIIYYALKRGWSPDTPGLVDFVVYGEDVDP